MSTATLDTIKAFVASFQAGDEEAATNALKECIRSRYELLITEDHEKVMTSDEMETHLKKLFSNASDDTKKKFLDILSKHSDLDTCSESDFGKCAGIIKDKGKIVMDKVIHSLEKLVGYKFNPEKVDENLGNVITKPSKGVPDGGADIPNAYTTKNTKKLKKKMHTLKKNVYGTGMQPAAAQGADFGGDGGGGSAGE